MPRVSVIVPAYNAAEHIGDTLASVVAQTFTDWEAVVADDASSDDTAARAAAVDPRVRVVQAEENAGPAATRNLAVANATGELLAFLDADDAWQPEFLEEMVGLYDRQTAAGHRVGIVACDAQIVGPDGSARDTHSERTGASGTPDLATLLDGNVIYVSALVPRAIVEELGGFSTETWGSEDHDLWIRILERGYEVARIPRALAIYRELDGSVSSSALGMARTNQATYRRALARGRLTPRQRRLAQRSLQLQLTIEAIEDIAARRAAGKRMRARDLATAARAVGVFCAFVLRHPSRWARWARVVAGGARTPWRAR